MAYDAWKDKVADFETADVRGVAGNFFPQLKSRAEKVPLYGGLHVVQTFEPISLYGVMESLGFERHTEKAADDEYHVYFYRARVAESSGDIALKPAVITTFPIIDNELAEIGVRFWDLTWNEKKRFLPNETRVLLSLANAVGAGRMRQAARELLKAYIGGIDSRALDDVFELFAWQQGIGFFASEIAPSTLFAAYKHIKAEEKRGKAREEICQALKEKFGDLQPILVTHSDPGFCP